MWKEGCSVFRRIIQQHGIYKTTTGRGGNESKRSESKQGRKQFVSEQDRKTWSDVLGWPDF